jgi:hypothetical protein
MKDIRRIKAEITEAVQSWHESPIIGRADLMRASSIIRRQSIEMQRELVVLLPEVIVRSRNEGVRIGWIAGQEGQVVDLLFSRQLRYWRGALDLSAVATVGVREPQGTIMSREVNSTTMLEACTIFVMSKEAADIMRSIKSSET